MLGFFEKFDKSQIVSCLLSSGSFQDKFDESNQIPSTVPQVDASKAFSKEGQGGASSTFSFLQIFL